MNFKVIGQKVRLGEYDLSEHAHKERQEEQISTNEIEQILLKGSIIEQYLNDSRGESCLVGGLVKDRPIHVVCGFRGRRLLVVTVYVPKSPIWIDFKTRAKELESRV